MTKTVEQWDIFEHAFHSTDAGNPDQDISLEAQFTHQSRDFHVEGFYDGNATHKIRFMPDQPGDWTFTTRSNLPALDGQAGRFHCAPAKPGNHGPVRVANQIHFAYADGTPYIPVGTTCYVWNLQGDELEERHAEDAREAPFNKMRMCVFPKRYRFNHNEPPCYPFPGEVTIPWDPAQPAITCARQPAAPFLGSSTASTRTTSATSSSASSTCARGHRGRPDPLPPLRLRRLGLRPACPPSANDR